MTEPRKKSPRCLICKKPVDVLFRPFCSARCKQIDLAKWLSGTYVIPGEEATEEEKEKTEEDDSSSDI